MKPRQPVVVTLVVAGALLLPSHAGAKEFDEVVVVGPRTASLTLHPPSVLLDGLFRRGSPCEAGPQVCAAPRGGYLRLFLLARGFPGMPGRFYPANGVACMSWRQPVRFRSCPSVTGALLRRLSRARGLPRFVQPPTTPHRLEYDGRAISLDNLKVAVELAFSLGGRATEQPARCFRLTATWRGPLAGDRPRGFGLCREGAYWRGRLYRLDRSLWEWMNLNVARAMVGEGAAPAAMTPLPRYARIVCRASRFVRAACPRRVPKAPALGLAYYPARPGQRADFLELLGFGKPRHVVLSAGDLRGYGGSFIADRSELPVTALEDGLLRRAREEPLYFGRVQWGARAGALFLAPGAPGIYADHLIFAWRQGASTSAVTLHGWEPLTRSAATLRAMVESLSRRRLAPRRSPLATTDPRRATAVRLTAPPRYASLVCWQSTRLRPGCPQRVPSAPLPAYNLRFSPALRQAPWDELGLEWSGQYYGNPARNRPPKVVRLVLRGGDLRKAFTFGKGGVPGSIENGLLSRPRTRTFSFGRVSWGGREGELLLTPSTRYVGEGTDHLIFRWRQAGRSYALSMLAWEPFVEAVATMHAIVETMPGAAAAAA